jgi:hypothetical protein
MMGRDMRNQNDIECIAEKLTVTRRYLDIELAKNQRLYAKANDQRGSPEPLPPGGYGRTYDWGLSELRTRAYKALRRGEPRMKVTSRLPA